METFTFNPERYHTSIDEVRELMADRAGTFSDTTPDGHIIVRYNTPIELQTLFMQLGNTKKTKPNTAVAMSGFRKKKVDKRIITVVVIAASIAAIVLIRLYCR
jgi:hypothetical protein